VLVVTVTVLALIGLIMVLSASSVASLSVYGSAWVVFARQLGWMLIAVLCFAIASRFDYRRLQRWSVPLLIAAFVLLFLVLIPGIGIYVSGSRRWLGFGAFRFQPSEIAKLALLIFAADLLTRRHHLANQWRSVLLPVVGVFSAMAVLVILEPDMDSTMVLALIVGSVLVVGGVRMRDIGIMLGTGIGLSALLAVAAPYRRARVFSFLDPFAQADGPGYQLAQSLIALGSGGLTGVGLGASRQKWLFLPNAHTDFIFAIIGEELGLIGAALVLALFAALAVWGAMIAMRAPDRFGMLVAAGITTWIVGQAIINIGAVIGVLPVSGIPLPFLSFGGSSLVFTMIAAGILANIARQSARHGSGEQSLHQETPGGKSGGSRVGARIRSVRVPTGAPR
jgi:cell division protein FtsW